MSTVTVGVQTPVHPMFVEVTERLRGAGVRWALLRSPRGGLLAPAGDVDMVVHPDDLALAVTQLASIGFVRLPRAGTDIHLLRYAEVIDKWLWLHTTTVVEFGSGHRIEADGNDGWMSRRRTEDSMPRLGKDLEFWALLWHCLAEKDRVAAHHCAALRAAAEGAGTQTGGARAFQMACGDATLVKRCHRAVRANDWSAIQQTAAEWNRAPRRSANQSVLQRIRRAASHRLDALRHWRARRGLSVAILGPDGAGKSTLIEGLANTIPLSTRTVYMGLTGGAIRYARRLRVPGLVFVATACIVWSRYLRAWVQMLRGRLVLFDRYVYDAVAPPGYTPGPFERIGRRLSGRLCPAPDLVLLLDAPGTIMFSRKGEYDAARLEQWRRCFLSLARRSTRVQVIDASRSKNTVRADATGRIWRQYAEHLDATAGATRTQS